MKVGDYVRTKDGIIFKWNKLCTIDKKDYEEHTRKILFVENEIKSSPNIIDLIERFDFVNGHLVICKMYEDEKDIPTIIKCVGNYYFKEEDIKSIVTKEQFSCMEYKIGE